MNGTTHMMVGIAVGMVVAPASLPAIAMGALGGLLPDIDHPNSKIGRRLLPAALVVNAVFGHRGITHSLLIVCGIGILCALAVIRGWLPYPLFVTFVASYAAHLLCDALTPRGIPLLYPIPSRVRVPLVWRFSDAIELVTIVSAFAIIVLQFVNHL